MEVQFITSPHGPAIETPEWPALGFVFSQDGNRLDAWFLTALAEGLAAVLSGKEPAYVVAQDEVSAEITHEKVEIVVSEQPDGTATFRECVPIQECFAAVSLWRRHLMELSEKRT